MFIINCFSYFKHVYFYTFYLSTYYLLVFSGDPDLFIAQWPNTHPTSRNFTFSAASIGADTVTVQSTDPLLRCHPDAKTSTSCDFYIGVYSWHKPSRYTITASLDTGYYNPNSNTILKDGVPQTGTVQKSRYVYYTYNIPKTGRPIQTLITVTVSNN